jgi:predicted nucleic acid-binding protein
MTTLLDTSVVIALTKPSDPFHTWAVATLAAVKVSNPPAAICPVTFAEASPAYASSDLVATALEALGIERIDLSDEALFQAGQAFKAYKDRGGTKDGVLPDFIIGAVAVADDIELVTSNGKDFVKSFKSIKVILPP